MTPSAAEPYLSVVATARNDNHGGDLLHRMQTFVNALAAQCERHRIPTELVLVEWNPPPDRARLTQALEWPEPSPWFSARVVEVGPDLHVRLRYGSRLPLFQMIAKNVGIRRARGAFVLATNVDLVFSDELMAFLARRRLDKRRLYRVDRYDVDFPLDPHAPLTAQLDRCERSLIRVCSREGTADLRTGAFFRIYEKDAFLQGWLRERLLLVRYGRQLVELLQYASFFVRLARLVVRRAFVRIQLLALRLAYGVAGRLRRWSRACVRTGRRFRHPERIPRVVARNWQRQRWLRDWSLASVRTVRRFRHPGRIPRVVARGWRLARRRLERRARATSVRLPDRRRHLLLALPLLAKKAATAATERFLDAHERVAWALADKREELLVHRIELQAAWERDKARVRLHTNACGDFTLLSREGWFATRGYPELELFSMHLDSLFLYQAHYSGILERFLRYRVYHLEHGSGFRPDDAGLRALNDRLERSAIPQVSNEQFLEWALEMFRTRRPMVFNDESWGFADEPLPEALVVARHTWHGPSAAARPEVVR